ncbi:hypothetical protein SCG7086_BO_00090 [Chlamydiales bacterium SCGC AG-110-P3]|nr:hypothetical protein SCG7086_BO_00090 [Chlamydiales bacterium SCGC AG-110-P3]
MPLWRKTHLLQGVYAQADWVLNYQLNYTLMHLGLVV